MGKKIGPKYPEIFYLLSERPVCQRQALGGLDPYKRVVVAAVHLLKAMLFKKFKIKCYRDTLIL